MTSCLSIEYEKRLHEGGLVTDEKLKVKISKLHDLCDLGKDAAFPFSLLIWERWEHLQSPSKEHFKGELQATFHKQHHTVRRRDGSPGTFSSNGAQIVVFS